MSGTGRYFPMKLGLITDALEPVAHLRLALATIEQEPFDQIVMIEDVFLFGSYA
jgi:hypothetical protein